MQDEAWKEVIEKLFPDFLAFFFPQIHRDINFSKGFEFLDKELQGIVLIHIEVQGYKEQNFSNRIYIYNYRIYDRHGKEVISLALLTDADSQYRPTMFRVSRWGFELSFKFPIIKLIDYKDQWHRLEKSTNPFSIVVMSFLKTLETQGNEQDRYSWKKRFLIELYDRGLTREIIFLLYKFIDIVMSLSEELDSKLTDEILRIEEDKKMAIITSAERAGIKKGKIEGKREGKREGRIEGLHEIIFDIFDIKFGKNIYETFPQLKQIQDIKILQQIRLGLKKAANLEESKNLILQQLSNGQKN